MTHTLMALGLAALAQSTDTTTFADAATEALIVQARHRHAYQDSLVRDYSATVRTRIDVGFGRSRFARVSPILAHESAAMISWSLPNDLFMTTFGEYDVNRSVLPKFGVALDSTLEQTDFGEHRRRKRSGPRCPEVVTATDSARVSCGSEMGYSRAGVRGGGGRWEIHYPPHEFAPCVRRLGGRDEAQPRPRR